MGTVYAGKTTIKKNEKLTNGKVQKFWVAEFWARNATECCAAREVDRTTQSFQEGPRNAIEDK